MGELYIKARNGKFPKTFDNFMLSKHYYWDTFENCCKLYLEKNCVNVVPTKNEKLNFHDPLIQDL